MLSYKDGVNAATKQQRFGVERGDAPKWLNVRTVHTTAQNSIYYITPTHSNYGDLLSTRLAAGIGT
jgi:hypothetical protein